MNNEYRGVKMKRFWFFLLCFFALMLHAENLSKNVKLDLKVNSLKKVEFEFVNGNMDIIGTKTDRLKVTGKVSVEGKDQASVQEVLNKVKLTHSFDGDSLSISLNYDDLKDYLGNSGFFNFFCSGKKRVRLAVNLKVELPERMRVHFSGVNFDVEIKNLKSADVEDVNGDINISNLDRVKCENVNGNVVLRNIRKKVSCDIVNGNLEFSGNSLEMVSISVNSVNGNCTIKLPFKAIGNVETSSITSKSILVYKGKKIKGRNIEFQGDGNCDIEIDTINGRVYIEGF